MQTRHGLVPLLDGFGVHFDQFEDVLPGLAQLQVQLFKFVLIHPKLMPAGFKRCRATKPVAGVFDFVRVHTRALLILFLYTVIDVPQLREEEATNWSFLCVTFNNSK